MSTSTAPMWPSWNVEMDVTGVRKRFVTYYRVSTDKQGKSGLGLEAQQADARRFLANKGWPPVAEFVEVESGRKSARPKLAEALEACGSTRRRS